MLSATKVNLWNRALDKIGHTNSIESESDDTVERAVCERHYEDLLREMMEVAHWPWALRQQSVTSIASQILSYAGDDVTVKFTVPPFFQTTKLAITLDDVEQTGGTDYTITAASAGSAPYITMTSAPATGETLKATVTVSRVGWDYAYALPNDFVTLVGLLYSDTRFTELRVARRAQFQIVPNDQNDGFILVCDFPATNFDGIEYIAMPTNLRMIPRVFINALVAKLAIPLAYALQKEPRLASKLEADYQRNLELALAQTQNMNNDGEAEPNRPLTPSMAIRNSFFDDEYRRY